MIDLIILIFVFAVGAVVGSFLNVCIVRFPQGQSVVSPGSHCVYCHKPIAWHDNIPIFSYFFLFGRCRYCRAKISVRYPVVELVTAVFFVIFYLYFGRQSILLPYLVFVSALIVATFVDIEHRIIPDEVSIGGMVAGLLFSAMVPQLHATNNHFLSLGHSLLGVLVGGGSIYLLGMLGDFIFKKESMGGGDIKLLAMIGSFLGWKAAVLAFFIAPFFGAILGIIVKIRTKESLIPYGPFLALGALISLFWSGPIIQWIIHGYGLT